VVAEDRPEREIEFMGRKIWVKFPRPEQILVWKRILVQLQSANDGWNGEQVLAALERTRRIIDSVMANQVDKDWLDDQMLDGTVTLADTAPFVTLAVQAFADDDNRESRRAATKKAPAKKASRKHA
jgi:hypothetical protein